MSSVKDLFLKLTKSTMPGGHEHLMEQYFPKGWKKDSHGNYYIKVGDNPTTMFTSHIDTADTGQPKDVTHVIEGNIVKTDGKTILGADDKAGTSIMLYMIEKGKEGLYYFFLNEEHGCVGSRALQTLLKGGLKNDDLYKNINKVIALDRRDDDSVITYQVGERCCSQEFAEELSKRLNAAGGFKYKPDPTGAVTDSHHVADIFPECTNLSVGYDDQHTVREKQDVEFLQKLADACVEVDWETLPIKRDPSKVEYSYSTGGRRGRFYGSEWDNDRWWETSSSSTSPRATSVGPGSLPKDAQFVTDYLGNEVRVSDAQWCEYDKQWCAKSDAIWVDYVGFYTTPDYDPAKVKPKASSGGAMRPIKIEDLKKDLDIYSKDGTKFGTVMEVGDMITLATGEAGSSKFVCPPQKFLTYNFYMKPASGGSKLMEKDLKEGLTVFHPSFGEGRIIGIRPDKQIIKVAFKEKGEKDLRVDVADMKF